MSTCSLNSVHFAKDLIVGRIRQLLTVFEHALNGAALHNHAPFIHSYMLPKQTLGEYVTC